MPVISRSVVSSAAMKPCVVSFGSLVVSLGDDVLLRSWSSASLWYVVFVVCARKLVVCLVRPLPSMANPGFGWPDGVVWQIVGGVPRSICTVFSMFPVGCKVSLHVVAVVFCSSGAGC